MSSSAPVLPPTLVPVPPIAPAQPPSMDSPVIRQDPPFELLVVPPPTFCEVNVGPNVRNCRECVPSAGLVAMLI